MEVGQVVGTARERVQTAEDLVVKAGRMMIEEAQIAKLDGDIRYRYITALNFNDSPRFKSGDNPEALQHYSLSLQHNPRDPRVLSSRAAVYYNREQWAECIKVG